MRNKKTIIIATIIILFSIIGLVRFSSAAITKEINYQGKLTNSANNAVADASYNMTFVIYNASSGGQCLWTARGNCTATSSRAITTSSGLFSIMLGDTSDGDNALNLNFATTTASYYLGITVGSDSEMTPRKLIGSVPMAFNANNLIGNGTVSLTSSSTSPIIQTNASSTVPMVRLIQNGASGSLLFAESANGNALAPASTTISLLQFSSSPLSSGSSNGTFIGANPASFTGNFVDFQVGGTSKFIVDSSGNATTSGYLVIGTTQPTMNMSAGDLLIGNNATTTGSFSAGGALYVQQDTGRVGIGTTAPTYTLDVAGDIGLNQYLYHNDDTNTYFQFVNDRVKMLAGGDWFLDANEGDDNLFLGTDAGMGYAYSIYLGNKDTYIQGSTGNLGIGITNPTSTLSVLGSADIRGNATTTGNLIVGASVWDAPTSTLTVDGSLYATGNATTSGAFSAGGLLYVKNDTRRVGIGIAAPSVALEVSGYIKVSGGFGSTGDMWLYPAYNGIFTLRSGSGSWQPETGDKTFASFDVGTSLVQASANTVQLSTTGNWYANGVVTYTGSWTGVLFDTNFGEGSDSTYNGTVSIAPLKITPTINVNTGSTAGYTGILLNVTETSLSSTAQNYLLDLQVGSATKFSISNSGNATTTGAMYVGGDTTLATTTASVINKVVIVDGVHYPQTSAGINAAITALGSNGGKVFLPEGTYAISETIAITKSNTSLVGAGAGTILQLVASTDKDFNIIGSTSTNGIILRDFKINGNKAGQSSGAQRGIHFYQVASSTIENLWVENCRDQRDGSIRMEYSENNIISNNIVRDTGSDGTGIYLVDGSYNTVIGNNVYGAGTYGIYLDETSHNVITNNVLRRNGGDNYRGAINTYGASYNTISNNLIEYNTSNGIKLASGDNNTVIGNVIKSNNRHGIKIQQEANYNSIIGNILSNNSAGTNNTDSEIYIIDGKYNTITANNIYQGSGNKAKYGIAEEDYVNADYNLIQNNIVKDCATEQIRAKGYHTVVSGNRTSGTGAFVGEGLFHINTATTTDQLVMTLTATSTASAFTLNQGGVGSLMDLQYQGNTKFQISYLGNATTSGNLTLNSANPFIQWTPSAAGDKLSFQSGTTTLMSLDIGGTLVSKGPMSSNGAPDYAEFILSSQKLEIGDLVAVKKKTKEELEKFPISESLVERALKNKNEVLVGVIAEGSSSQAAGYLKNDYPDNAYLMTLSGRVGVKVCTENGPIKRGDYLTVSSIEGVAMKAIMPGPIVGTALEDFDGGNAVIARSPQGDEAISGNNDEIAASLSEVAPRNDIVVGKVLTLIHIGHYNPASGIALQGSDEIAGYALSLAEGGEWFSIDSFGEKVIITKELKVLENATFKGNIIVEGEIRLKGDLVLEGAIIQEFYFSGEIGGEKIDEEDLDMLLDEDEGNDDEILDEEILKQVQGLPRTSFGDDNNAVIARSPQGDEAISGQDETDNGIAAVAPLPRNDILKQLLIGKPVYICEENTVCLATADAGGRFNLLQEVEPPDEFRPAIGIIVEVIEGEEMLKVKVAIGGVIKGFGSLEPGKKYYLPEQDTFDSMAELANVLDDQINFKLGLVPFKPFKSESYIQVLGIAKSKKEFLVMPDLGGGR